LLFMYRFLGPHADWGAWSIVLLAYFVKELPKLLIKSL
jgi:hypothetical protein